MRNSFKKSICLTLASVLTFFDVAQAAGAATGAFNRNDELIKNITTSSKPSDLPIAGVSDFFDKEKVHLIQDFDLSKYIGKNVFVGYGVYDEEQDHCKFVEQPGVDKAFYDSVIHFSENFNQHAYAITQENMSYAQCKSLANKLGGYPVIPDSAAENAFISANFTKIKKDGKYIGNVWSGVFKKKCSNVNYTNAIDKNQNFLQWENGKEPMCKDEDPVYAQINAFGNLTRKAPSEYAKCLIEFNSADYKRPVRICASWWRVVRDYDGVKQTLYDVGMLNKINQADIPKEMTLCTKFDMTNVVDPSTMPTRIAHCTEYYDRTIAPECLTNPRQGICKIDECKGYINNACKLVRKDKVGKGYVKGEILEKGKITEHENKVDILTKEFECPASGISNKLCTERATVTVFPKECPGSRCEELKECLYNNADDPDKANECYKNIPCVKIYGNRDIPAKMTPDGTVTHLYGKCPDDTILEFPINVQEKLSKKCLQYEVLVKTERNVEKCTEDRSFHDHQVDMSITAKDIYEDDPKCIRMDSVHESQSKKTLAFRITPKGYFKQKITEVNLDAQNKIIGDDIGDDKYIISSAMVGARARAISISEKGKGGSGSSSGSPQSLEEKVEALMPKCNLQSSFTLRNSQIFANLEEPDITDSKDEGDEEGGGQLTNDVYNYSILNFYNGKMSVVQNGAGFTGDAQCTDWLKNNKVNFMFLPEGAQGFLKNGKCYFPVASSPYDSKISNFTPSGNTASFLVNGVLSEKACMEEAYCLNGRYTFSGTTCKITMPDGEASEQYGEVLKEEALKQLAGSETSAPVGQLTEVPTEQLKAPVGAKAEIRSIMLDGLKSVFFFEDYIRGGWGWYSNHNSYPGETNIVEVSEDGNAYANLNTKEKKMTKITDLLNYSLSIGHKWWKAKKPTTTALYLSGAMVGAAGFAAFQAATPYIAVLNIGAYLVLVFLNKSKNMDEQNHSHHLYKDVPEKYYYPGLYETRIPEDRNVLKKLSKSERDEIDKFFSNGVAMTPRESAVGVNEDDVPRIAPLDDTMLRFTYWKAQSETGRLKTGDVKKVLRELKTFKTNLWNRIGILPSETIFHPWENGDFGSNYPKCKKWRPWCTKSKSGSDGYHTPNSRIPAEFSTFSEGESNDKNGLVKVNVPLGDMSSPGKPHDKIRKETTTVYLGATNSLTVLVPYKGDYNVIAYDRKGDRLSSFLVTEDMFIEKYNTMIPSAQVRFGDNMELAVGIVNGAHKDACRSDKAVEWGGGVSGTFYENQRTEESDFCTKSIDNYVKTHSMAAIEVCPLNMDRCFRYELKFPLPFANRVWLASLNGKEIRNYRCYDDFSSCSEDNFVKDEGR